MKMTTAILAGLLFACGAQAAVQECQEPVPPKVTGDAARDKEAQDSYFVALNQFDKCTRIQDSRNAVQQQQAIRMMQKAK